VTGASRSAGRGIAVVLGACGATVYVTGRSVRGRLSSVGKPETIEETAELVAARGGAGIAVQVDHAVDEQVAALFARVGCEQGRLDLLVNNAWGGYEGYDQTFDAPFWEQPLARFDRMLTVSVRSTLVATRLALPLLLSQPGGLIVTTTVDVDACNWDLEAFGGNVLYTTAKTAINRMSFRMAHNLRPRGVAVVALAPARLRRRRGGVRGGSCAPTPGSTHAGETRGKIAVARLTVR
jgi:NAD(P)-dependent dehydrogenase (short-subunit alcohol dehydrogenase family)